MLQSQALSFRGARWIGSGWAMGWRWMATIIDPENRTMCRGDENALGQATDRYLGSTAGVIRQKYSYAQRPADLLPAERPSFGRLRACPECVEGTCLGGTNITANSSGAQISKLLECVASRRPLARVDKPCPLRCPATVLRKSETRYSSGFTPTASHGACAQPPGVGTGQREDCRRRTIRLYFFNARYLDPQPGRFTQPDTIRPRAGQHFDRAQCRPAGAEPVGVGAEKLCGEQRKSGQVLGPARSCSPPQTP
jgi:hypothetical protein